MAPARADPALWITWYDLPEEGRDAYLSWLHNEYVPKLLERPGVLWAAHYASEAQQIRTAKKTGRRYPPPGTVPQGHRFVLIAGGEDVRVFADPTPAQFHAGLPAADREMLGLRREPAMNVMLEQMRIAGPEAREAGTALSPSIQLGSYVFDGDEDELLAWYTQWRLPSMTGMPGCIGVRKLVSVAGWAKHAVLHEFTSVESRNANFVNHEQKKYPEKAAWSEKVTGQVIHAPGSPNAASRIWSAIKQ